MRRVNFPKKTKLVRLEDVYPDLNQPREYFDLEELALLGESILNNGLIKTPVSEEINLKTADPKLIEIFTF